MWPNKVKWPEYRVDCSHNTLFVSVLEIQHSFLRIMCWVLFLASKGRKKFFFKFYFLRHFDSMKRNGLYLNALSLKRTWFLMCQSPHVCGLCVLDTNTALKELGGKALLRTGKSSGNRKKSRQWREGSSLRLSPLDDGSAFLGSQVKRYIYNAQPLPHPALPLCYWLHWRPFINDNKVGGLLPLPSCRKKKKNWHNFSQPEIIVEVQILVRITMNY